MCVVGREQELCVLREAAKTLVHLSKPSTVVEANLACDNLVAPNMASSLGQLQSVVVVICGPVGIGKSSLCQHFVREHLSHTKAESLVEETDAIISPEKKVVLNSL